MPDPNERDVERDVLLDYKDHMSIIITSGNVASELTVIYGAFLVHTIRIYHPETSSLPNGIYVENEVNFENPPKNRETELFMRVVTDIRNGDPPQFYTDLNGFQMQKRVKVEQIEIEGNYFPITTMAYIEDEKLRLSLITNHAQGAAAWQPDCLEVMLDRRILYDDSRGMGEGVIDNRKTVNKYWLLFENYETEEPNRFASHRIDKRQVEKTEFSRPSLFANHLSNSLNYPVGIFIVSDEFSKLKVEHSLKLINKEFPCDYHILTFRTQVDPIYSQFPSNFALLVLHRQGYSCKINSNYTCKKFNIEHDMKFELLKVESIQPVTLTGLEDEGDSIIDLREMTLSPMTLQSYNFTFDMYM